MGRGIYGAEQDRGPAYSEIKEKVLHGLIAHLKQIPKHPALQIMILLLVGGMGIYLVSRYITRPIRKLDKLAAKIAEGDYELRSSINGIFVHAHKLKQLMGKAFQALSLTVNIKISLSVLLLCQLHGIQHIRVFSLMIESRLGEGTVMKVLFPNEERHFNEEKIQ